MVLNLNIFGNMYILVNNSRMILGIFTTKEKLDYAVKVVRDNEDIKRLYYQKVETDIFDKTLLNFFTLHPEKLIEIN